MRTRTLDTNTEGSRDAYSNSLHKHTGKQGCVLELSTQTQREAGMRNFNFFALLEKQKALNLKKVDRTYLKLDRNYLNLAQTR